MRYKFSPLALSFGSKQHTREVPFNREIVRAVKFWEQRTGLKFTKKILRGYGNFYCYTHITLRNSDVNVLFHELIHVKQHAVGRSSARDMVNYYNWICPRYPSDEYYFKLPCERDANRAAKSMTKDYLLTQYKVYR